MDCENPLDDMELEDAAGDMRLPANVDHHALGPGQPDTLTGVDDDEIIKQSILKYLYDLGMNTVRADIARPTDGFHVSDEA